MQLQTVAGDTLVELFSDDDDRLLAKAIGEFSGRELAPYLRQLGREEFPQQFLPLAGRGGFLGTAIPQEYGGQGGTLERFLPVLEGIAACDGSLALTLAAHESLATAHLFLGGSAEQNRQYLPELTAGRKVGAWCLTEPQAGSNIFKDTRTRLTRTADGWKLNGEKTFITNGCHADLFVVLALAIDADGQSRGMTACVVEKEGNANRILATPLHGKMGMWRSDTAALKFEDVSVADVAVLGLAGSGDRVARQVLARGRVGVGALALGLARDSLERATAYARERKVGGGRLYGQPLTRAKLSRMEANLWAAWQAVRGAARLADQSRPFKVQSCMAKVFATETALGITDEAIQILGGYGYMGDYKVEQNYRDARLLTIGEGATEILRFAIARSIFAAKPGEASVLPPAESLPGAAAPPGGPAGDLWGPGWRALQLAAGALDRLRAQIDEETRQTDTAAVWQCRAAAFADLATRLWVAHQALVAVATPEGGASHKQTQFARTFLFPTCIDICHQASEILRSLGLTDAELISNYVEALQVRAADCAASPE